MFNRIVLSFIYLLIAATHVCADESRPKIGLVLGGGGALGFAHIGVLKVLEEQQIPIDYIAGTSMGAIVAGMYASGMSPDEIEQQFISLNWWDVLKDQSPHQDLVYRRKEENKRFMGAELGFNHWKLQLSSGISEGQKLNNVIESFVLNSSGITDFDQLNIPYRAVATDLREGKSVVLRSGNLARAMRASMAVPGAFSPVRIRDQVFVDGGVFNNIPVDVAKEMGAEFIIAVDVGKSSFDKSKEGDFNTLGEVVYRTYTIMQRPDQEKQLSQADLVISPDLNGFSPAQFHCVKDIIPRGKVAAEHVRNDLATLSIDDTAYAVFLKKQRRIRSPEILINTIEIAGNDKVSEKQINYRVKSEKGPLDLETVFQDVSRIYGMGYFETVTFDIEPKGNAYALQYNAIEKTRGPGFLHFGLKFELATDASMLWGFLLNYTRTQLNTKGGELRVNLQGGGNLREVKAEWYQPLSTSGRFFLAPSVLMNDEDIDIYYQNDVLASVDQQEVTGMLDAGISGFQYGEIRVGIRGGHVWDSGNSGAISLGDVDESVVAGTLKIRFDQLDDPVFPTKGYQVWLNGLFSDQNIGSAQTYSRMEVGAMLPLTAGRHTLIPQFSAGSSFGTDLPFYATFFLGGMDNFAGYAPYQLFGNYYGLFNLGYRYRLGQLSPTFGSGVYALARFDAGNTWIDADQIDIDDLFYGGLIGISADTLIGRCMVAIGKADEIKYPRLYISIGNNF